jgi:hypothetical protein
MVVGGFAKLMADPTPEKETALQLIGNGCDVVFCIGGKRLRKSTVSGATKLRQGHCPQSL